MDNDIITLLAETNFRNQQTKFGIKTDDRRRHMYLIGKTGMGKSTVMENMIIQDIRSGHGVALVDPHGDFAEKILNFIPHDRINDVCYFNPSDMSYPIAFNVMESVSPEHKHLVSSGLIGVFKKLWAESWGPRLEYVLRNTILALLDYPGSTLLGVMRMLTDKTFRKKVIAQVTDPVVKAFWVDEYTKYPDRFQSEAIAPIQNKVGQFLSTSIIRNVVGQVSSSINIRDIMDQRKILIMNLSKGRMGEDSSALLGAMMITKIQLAAMSRIDTVETQRRDFYLYVDEFQNFATESFANILSEARKYRLNLIIAHQYIEQLTEEVQAAVFGNVGTMMCFRVGATDAEFLVKEFAPYFDEEDLVNLTKYEVYMKLMIDGVSSTPFSASTLPPLEGEDFTVSDKVIKVSRERYSKSKIDVEDKIARWSGMISDGETLKTASEVRESQKAIIKKPTEKLNATKQIIQTKTEQSNNKIETIAERITEIKKDSRSRSNKNQDPKPKVNENNIPIIPCNDCGEEVKVNFKPDGVRPIYCKKCFQKKLELPSSKSHQAVIKNNEKPVSLIEAFKTGAVSFTGKKINDEEKKVHTKNEQKNISIKEQAKHNILNPHTQKTSSLVTPGQVIKF